MTNYDFHDAAINNYSIVKLIGAGAYGLVFLVQNSVDNQLYAMKVIAKKFDKSVEKQSDHLIRQLHHHLPSFRSLNRLNLVKLGQSPTLLMNSHPFMREINLHLQVHHHPNVITIHEILDSSLAVFVIMDYYEEGDLFSNIVDKSIYCNSKPSLIKRVFAQLIDVIAYCHSKGIYHCDIKPENIMCDSDGEKLVIGDFGLSTTERYMNSHKCIGSSYYMPPERLITVETDKDSSFTTLDKDLSYPSNMGDLWSLSIILINLTCMRNPWNKACAKIDRTYKAFKSKPQVLKDILPLSDDLYEVLIKCLKENPYERLSLFEFRDLVMKCKTFTTKGSLSEEEEEEEEEQIKQTPDDHCVPYASSSDDDSSSLNSYGQDKDDYEDDYETNGFHKHYVVDGIKFGKKIEIVNKDRIKNVENVELLDNYSTIANASFNINFDLQQEMVSFFT